MDPFVNMTWRAARAFAAQYDQAVRRWSWRRWVSIDSTLLWFSDRTYLETPVSHVTEADEHTAEDKLADDWTNIPFDDTPPIVGPPGSPPLYPPPRPTRITDRYTDDSPILTIPPGITFDVTYTWDPGPDGTYLDKFDPGPDGILNTDDDIGPDGIPHTDDDLNVTHPACYVSLPATLSLTFTVTVAGGNPLSVGTLEVTIPGVTSAIEVGAPGVSSTATVTITTADPPPTLFAHYHQPAMDHVTAAEGNLTQELDWPPQCPP